MSSLWKTLINLKSKPLMSANAISALSFTPKRFLPSLYAMHLRYMKKMENCKPAKKKSPLDGKPYSKGLILRTLIKKPRKPNSANRKCLLVKLSSGKEMVAFVPGVGHNLQEHQTVLCRVGRVKDTPGVKIRCERGKYDLPHVKTGD